MSSICQNCSSSIPAHAQMYQVDDSIVCAVCAGVSSASSQLAAAVRASGARQRRSGRASGVGIGVFAFVAVMLGVAGGIGYLIYSGKLAEAVTHQRDAMNGTSTTNSVIGRYNALVSQANALATDGKYAEAAQVFRDARAVASALPDIEKEIDLAQLDSIIAHYEAVAAGRTPRSVDVRTVHVQSPAAPSTTDSQIAGDPAEPHIGFMEKGIVAPGPVAPEAVTDSEPGVDSPQTNPARSRTDAYTVPK